MYTCCGEKNNIDLVESLNEEEEGDDNKSKDCEESKLARNYFVSKIQYLFLEVKSVKQYAADNQLNSTVVIDVQTPPPENTLL